MPTVTYIVPVKKAVEMAHEEIVVVCTSIDMVVGKDDDRLAGMERTKILQQTLAALRSFRAPTPPACLEEYLVEFPQYVSGRVRGASRRDRCNNASYALRAIIERICVLQLDVMKLQETWIVMEDYKKRLSSIISILETVQFPSQFHKRETVDDGGQDD